MQLQYAQFLAQHPDYFIADKTFKNVTFYKHQDSNTKCFCTTLIPSYLHS